MPYIETLDDIIEELADLFYVWGGHTEGVSCDPSFKPKEGQVFCRVCWTAWLYDRITMAMKNEDRLLSMTRQPATPERTG